MERIVAVDPGFSSCVLALANATVSGYEGTIVSIHEAIELLGNKELRRLATRTVLDAFAGKNDRRSLRRRSWWRHSVDTASCCHWIASHTQALPPNEAYTCGLAHYLGKNLLDRSGGRTTSW